MKRIACVLLLGLTAAGSLAMAQSGGGDGPGRQGPQGPSQGHQAQHGGPGGHHDQGRPGGRGAGPGQGPGREAWGSNGWRGGQPHGWARGENFRQYYRGPTYVVRDYGRYHLRRPPNGYHWIRDNSGNYLMVAIASGVIADLLMH